MPRLLLLVAFTGAGAAGAGASGAGAATAAVVVMLIDDDDNPLCAPGSAAAFPLFPLIAFWMASAQSAASLGEPALNLVVIVEG